MPAIAGEHQRRLLLSDEVCVHSRGSTAQSGPGALPLGIERVELFGQRGPHRISREQQSMTRGGTRPAALMRRHLKQTWLADGALPSVNPATLNKARRPSPYRQAVQSVLDEIRSSGERHHVGHCADGDQFQEGLYAVASKPAHCCSSP